MGFLLTLTVLSSLSGQPAKPLLLKLIGAKAVEIYRRAGAANKRTRK